MSRSRRSEKNHTLRKIGRSGDDNPVYVSFFFEIYIATSNTHEVIDKESFRAIKDLNQDSYQFNNKFGKMFSKYYKYWKSLHISFDLNNKSVLVEVEVPLTDFYKVKDIIYKKCFEKWFTLDQSHSYIVAAIEYNKYKLKKKSEDYEVDIEINMIISEDSNLVESISHEMKSDIKDYIEGYLDFINRRSDYIDPLILNPIEFNTGNVIAIKGKVFTEAYRDVMDSMRAFDNLNKFRYLDVRKRYRVFMQRVFVPDRDCEENENIQDPISLETIPRFHGFRLQAERVENNPDLAKGRCYDVENLSQVKKHLGPLTRNKFTYMDWKRKQDYLERDKLRSLYSRQSPTSHQSTHTRQSPTSHQSTHTRQSPADSHTRQSPVRSRRTLSQRLFGSRRTRYCTNSDNIIKSKSRITGRCFGHGKHSKTLDCADSEFQKGEDLTNDLTEGRCTDVSWGFWN